MIRPTHASLLAVALALLGVIALELRGGRTPADVPPASMPSSLKLPEVATMAVDRRQDQTAPVLARPLFSKSRRPVPAADGARAVAASVPRLSGILISPRRRTAIFAPTEGGKPVVISEGEHLGAFIVQTIDPGEVTIMGPNGSRLLRPTFDEAAPGSLSLPGAATHEIAQSRFDRQEDQR
jgi:hypothetical protein